MVEYSISLLVCLTAAAAFWLANRWLVNRLSGLHRRLTVDTGPVLRSSRWGDADVNGVGFLESIRVVECRNGCLVRAHWVFGGGQLWLPRDQTRVGGLERGGWCGASRPLDAGPERVRLEGDLAEFVAEAGSSLDQRGR
jgi:hypothetical protein